MTDLVPGVVTTPTLSVHSPLANSQSLPAQQAAATLPDTKRRVPPIAFEAATSARMDAASVGSGGAGATALAERPIVIQPVYGFSVLNSETGEAYLVEVVDADLDVPDQLPNPTTNKTYDPYYVRVVFLATRVAYSMSIIVPTIAYDQHRYFAEVHTEYANVVSETDELRLGYLHSDRAADEGLATLELAVLDAVALRRGLALTPGASELVYSNLPYAVVNADSTPITLEVRSVRVNPPAPYFLCRRLNWDVDCHLMRATHAPGSTAFLAFGGGDLAPLMLDRNPVIDRTVPGHFGMFTESFTSRDFASVRAVTVNATPLAVAVTTQTGSAEYLSLFIDPSNLGQNPNDPLEGALPTTGTSLTFPTDCYVVGEATATLTRLPGTTGDFASYDENGNLTSEFALVPYDRLVYLVRAVPNVSSLATLGGLGITSGLLIDTFVPGDDRQPHARPGRALQAERAVVLRHSYTPTTMVDSLDNLDFTSITGETFYAPTIFIPIPELDASTGFVADLSDFLGAAVLDLRLPRDRRAARATGRTASPTPTASTSTATASRSSPCRSCSSSTTRSRSLFTPNDLTHKYPLQPKQQVLALTNGQMPRGHLLAYRRTCSPTGTPPHNICAQQIAARGPVAGMDRRTSSTRSHNRPVATPTDYATTWACRCTASGRSRAPSTTSRSRAFPNDQTAHGLHLAGVVERQHGARRAVRLRQQRPRHAGGLRPGRVDQGRSCFLNGYLGAAGYAFSSPDHFDVNDVLPSQTAAARADRRHDGHWDVAFYNTDVSLPRAVLELHLRHASPRRACRTSSRRAAVPRRSDLHQPHALAAAEPAEPGAPRRARPAWTPTARSSRRTCTWTTASPARCS